MPHRTRPPHKDAWPVHVTLRTVDEIDVLRSERVYAAIERSVAKAQRDNFRIVLFSAQMNHVHLVVEGDDREQLIRGVHGLTVRMAKAINRAMGRRGKVWGDRYHARAMTMPLDVRNTISYDFQNFRKHTRAPAGFDPCSSAAWFEGWIEPPPEPDRPSPCVPPKSWLLKVGWRRHGLLSPTEKPASA